MSDSVEEQPRRHVPRDGAGGETHRRRIDCAPRQGAPEHPSPQTGRGRGIPDPERWSRGHDAHP